MTALLTRLYNAPGWMQRTVMLVLTVLVMALLLFLTAGVVGKASQNAAAIQEQRLLLGRLEAAANRKPLSTAAHYDASALYQAGENQGLVQAKIQAGLNAVAARNKVVVSSVNYLPIREEQGVELVGLSLNLTGNLQSVYRFLESVEQSAPPLLIDRLSIDTATRQVLQTASPVVLLNAKVDVFGAMKPAEDALEGSGQ